MRLRLSLTSKNSSFPFLTDVRPRVMPRCNAPRILDAYLHRSLEVCNWHAPPQSSQPSCLRFTATSLDDIGWSPPDWSSALFSAGLVKFGTVNDLMLRRILSAIGTRARRRHLSRYRTRSRPYKFLGTVFVVNLHQLWNCMFSRAWLIHWLSRYLRRAILLAFSVDPGVRTLKDSEASCFALHTLCSCSGCGSSQPCRRLYDHIFTFYSREWMLENNVFADTHSNTEYEILQKPVSRPSNVVRRRGA
jgi:hypothetical protein